MERIPQFERTNFEREKDFNFLGEQIKTYVFVDPEAAEYLPKITKQDLANKKERYRILMGEYGIDESDENKVFIFIKSILEAEPDKEPGYYQEGKEEVIVNLPRIKDLVRKIQERNPEFRQQNLVGEIHTHPVAYGDPTLSVKQRPWHPSKEDFDPIENSYRDKILTPDKPFIFGIAGLNKNSKTRYGFYKAVKRGAAYTCSEVFSQMLEN